MIKQGDAKLASSILATINGNITSPMRGKSIITNYKNAVSFSFKDDDFPPLPSPAAPNHCGVSNNVGNSAPDITKCVQTRKFDIHCRPDTNNICNTVVCVCNVNVCYNHSNSASHNHNCNINFQHVSVSSCDRPCNDSCFHYCVNGVKSSKTVRDLSVSENVTTDFCSNSTNEPRSLHSFVNMFTNMCLLNALVVQILVPHLSGVMLVSLFL